MTTFKITPNRFINLDQFAYIEFVSDKALLFHSASDHGKRLPDLTLMDDDARRLWELLEAYSGKRA